MEKFVIPHTHAEFDHRFGNNIWNFVLLLHLTFLRRWDEITWPNFYSKVICKFTLWHNDIETIKQ